MGFPNMRVYRRKILMTIVVAFSVFLLLFHYNSSSPKITTEPDEQKSNSWHEVFESTYIYSAFWDERDSPPHIKIIAIGPYDERLSKLRCSVKVQGEESVPTDAIFRIVDFENNGMKHTPIFFLCYPKTSKKPTHVALSIYPGTLSSWLPVQATSPDKNASGKIAVCVRPLFGSQNDYNDRLVEFITYYQLLGVSHFVFYDYQVDPTTKRLLLHLLTEGVVSLQLLPWSIPVSVKDSWQNGQVASITDCVYRLASSYEFVLIVDVDELIVPRTNVTLQMILKSFEKSSLPSASYIFRQVFFCSDSKDDARGTNLPLHLVTQTKVIRQNTISPWSSRAKSIVRPTAVILPGIHKILLTHGKWQSVAFVDPRTAFIHHYRNGVCSFWEKLGYGMVEDITAFRYRRALLNSLPVKTYLTFHKSQ